MKLPLYYVVRKYTHPDSIKAYGELRYRSGPFHSWIDAQDEIDDMRHSEGYIVVHQVIDVEEGGE